MIIPRANPPGAREASLESGDDLVAAASAGLSPLRAPRSWGD
ncbi:hypothetical protein [Sphingopyxis sp. H115]|nr:hypothetical protein [Sphingopyxis sp. H115]